MNRGRLLLLSLVMLAATSGCKTPPPPVVKLTSPFDEAQAAELLEPGENTIEGSALIRQQGGGVVTCAGAEVTLVPVTDYATERMVAIYGSTERGYRFSGTVEFEPTPDAYTTMNRKVIGDAQGRFVFRDVADGEFYVVTTVEWYIGYARQGGVLMQRVAVAGGEVKTIVLSP